MTTVSDLLTSIIDASIKTDEVEPVYFTLSAYDYNTLRADKHANTYYLQNCGDRKVFLGIPVVEDANVPKGELWVTYPGRKTEKVRIGCSSLMK